MIDWLFNANISNISAISWYLRFTVCKKKLNGMHNNIKLVLLWAQLTKKYPPPSHICPTYFHNQNITDCSDQKWKGPSSLHR
jgi:hypothetical protein